ncbi:MAG: heavy-metal-associated domain-containing protein [Pseudomonadota bacterium]|nr:heavy-metal-associated domain-containing protein [Sphingomonas sp.]MDQ3478027.1 heavy-metal-associated domain-containing protein [Pseudomonadota bacterium]
MARRPWFLSLLLFLGLAAGAGIYAQMESGERGILPLDSSGTLEVSGIRVDVGGKDAQSARYAGWRVAQRLGFKKLWAQARKLPISQAPNLPDSVLDQLVSSIIVEREQIGPTRYIADLGVLFDRSRAGQLIGIGGVEQRSQPMLLIPITISAGTMTSVELRNAWQRAWAQYRTSQSAIDYVRISGMGGDPLLINAAQTLRPGRAWWRNILDLYGAADILVAEVMIHRLYPGGPAQARFIGRHGPDREVIGGFTLQAANSAQLPQMMALGVQRMDRLFSDAFDAGLLQRDPTLDQPPPPPPPLEEDGSEDKPSETRTAPSAPVVYTVQIVAPNALTYNSALAHLRTVPGVARVDQLNIVIGDVSNFNVVYRGDINTLRSILAGRGWGVEVTGNGLRMFPPRGVINTTPQPLRPPPGEPANSVEPQSNTVSPAPAPGGTA